MFVNVTDYFQMDEAYHMFMNKISGWIKSPSFMNDNCCELLEGNHVYELVTNGFNLRILVVG